MADRYSVALSRPLPGEFSVEGADVRVGPARGFAERVALVEFFRGADAIVTWVSERIDEELLEAVGAPLKIVANFAVGYDNIDVGACRRRGIVVTNTPDAVTEGTADCAVALLLAAARKLTHAHGFVESGAWAEYGLLGPNEMIGMPIAGKKLLIVGAGRIGYATAVRMLGWGVEVLYVARSRKPAFEFAPLNARRVELDAGLAEADFVSVHTPLTEETRHLLDERRIGLMKPTAVVVNTSRGAVMDEAALATALREGRIFAAGLDVFEEEPRVHPGLVGLENVVMTPHYGSASRMSREAMTALCIANIEGVLSGRGPVTPV